MSIFAPGEYRCDECGRYSDGEGYPYHYCPLCESSGNDIQDLDFHHWDYDKDIGVHICRECHNTLHDGMRAHQQTQISPDGETWRTDVILNLINTHENIHGALNSWNQLFERYNIPQHGEYDWIRDIDLKKERATPEQ
jgi:hypothetical protein